eukprot:g24449.t1
MDARIRVQYLASDLASAGQGQEDHARLANRLACLVVYALACHGCRLIKAGALAELVEQLRLLQQHPSHDPSQWLPQREQVVHKRQKTRHPG